MEYTQQQVRSAIGIGQQAFRYWKRSLSPLANKSGKAALFSVGEMLALSIIHRLVQSYRMDVSAIAPIANELFDFCSRPLLFSRHPTLMWLDLETGTLSIMTDPKSMPIDRLCLIVPVSQLWRQLGESLTHTDRPGDQKELLPLASVG